MDGVDVVLPPALKGTLRIVEKAELNAGAPGDTSRILDVVRGMVVCRSMRAMVNVVHWFRLRARQQSTRREGEKEEQLELKLKLEQEADATNSSSTRSASSTSSRWDDDDAGRIVVVRAKDRFSQPTAGGWADLMLCFYMAQDPARHVCEVQLVHVHMLTQRKGLPGHIV